MKELFVTDTIRGVLDQYKAGKMTVQTATEVLLGLKSVRPLPPEPGDVFHPANNEARRLPEHSLGKSELDSLRAWRRDYESAVTALVVIHAETDSEVKSFRAEVLGNKLLVEPDAAHRWLRERGRAGPHSIDRIELFVNHRSLKYRISQDDQQMLRLKNLSQRLSYQYRWPEGIATLFVLTGLSMKIPAIEAAIDNNPRTPCLTRIVLEIDPALPVEYVARRYILERSKLRKRWRPLSQKHLQLAFFVARQSVTSPLNAQIRAKDWHDLWMEWEMPIQHGRRHRLKNAEEKTKLFSASEQEIELKFATFRRDAKQALRRLWDPIGRRDPPCPSRPVRAISQRAFLKMLEKGLNDYKPQWMRKEAKKWLKEEDRTKEQ